MMMRLLETQFLINSSSYTLLDLTPIFAKFARNIKAYKVSFT